MTDKEKPDLRVVAPPEFTPNADLIGGLRAILLAAEAGEIDGIVAAEFKPNGSFQTRAYGSTTTIVAIAGLASALHDMIEMAKGEDAP